MLYRPFLSGSNMLPVKTALLLSVLKNKYNNPLALYHFDARNFGAGSKSQLGARYVKISIDFREIHP